MGCSLNVVNSPFSFIQKGESYLYSKRGFLLNANALSCMGMTELEAFGMEVHTVGGLSVERIAQDGAVHAVRMGRVDAELVGTAAFGIVGHAGTEVFLAFYREGLGT